MHIFQAHSNESVCRKSGRLGWNKSYAAEQQAQILTLTAKNIFQLKGQNPYTDALVKMGNVSNLCQFGC